MCLQHRRVQYTERRQNTHSNLKQPRIPRLGFSLYLAAMVLAAWATAPSPVLASAPASASPSALAELPAPPVLYLDSMGDIYRLLGGDPGEFEKDATTVEKGMSMVTGYYTLHGLPALLSPTDRLALMQDIRQLYCLLQTDPPSDVDPLVTQKFLGILGSMWADLGGLPGDLGC